MRRAPERWKESCAHTECTLHQLSPYIGKIKSSIAGELVELYSKPGDLVADCFAGLARSLLKQRSGGDAFSAQT